MSRSSIKYIDNTYLYKQKQAVRPVSSPVIYGSFPKYVHKKNPSEKLNKFLNVTLILLTLLALVSYYFVSDSEKTMNVLGHEIVSLINENIELQNKLDNLNSFKKMDSVISTNTSLDTARMVMEIPAAKLNSNSKEPIMPVNYYWSIGY